MAKVRKIAGPKGGARKLDSPWTDTLDKPTEQSSHTSHSTDIDSKGVKHHRIHHTTSVSYETKGDKPAPTMMNELLAKRGK